MVVDMEGHKSMVGEAMTNPTNHLYWERIINKWTCHCKFDWFVRYGMWTKRHKNRCKCGCPNCGNSRGGE